MEQPCSLGILIVQDGIEKVLDEVTTVPIHILALVQLLLGTVVIVDDAEVLHPKLRGLAMEISTSGGMANGRGRKRRKEMKGIMMMICMLYLLPFFVAWFFDLLLGLL